MSKKESPFEFPIQIDYQPPSWLMTALTFAYAGAIICLFSVAVSAWIKCIALFFLLWRYIENFKQYRNAKYAQKSAQLFFNAENEWYISDPNGEGQNASLLPYSFVHPNLLVLRLRTEDNKFYNFILTSDNTNPELLRRLRVRLRYPIGNKSKQKPF